MTVFSQNSSNDIYIDGNGQFAMSKGLEAYKFIIEDAVRTQLGEKQLDENLGVPYFETVFSDKRDVLLWKDKMKNVVMSYDFVLSISNFVVNVDYGKKVLSYRMDITTNAGDLTISS